RDADAIRAVLQVPLVRVGPRVARGKTVNRPRGGGGVQGGLFDGGTGPRVHRAVAVVLDLDVRVTPAAVVQRGVHEHVLGADVEIEAQTGQPGIGRGARYAEAVPT